MEDPELYTRLSRLTLQNKDQGFFKQLITKLSFVVNVEEFSRCGTDLERITYCAAKCWDLVGAELIFKGKSAEDAVARRLEGNAAFERKDYQKALLLYSQSIIRAPVGPDLALVYANRSALFHKLSEWDHAITDVEMAINYSYPEINRHKLYERMGTCHLNLNNPAKAKISLKLSQHLALKHDPQNSKFLNNVEKLLKRSESSSKVPINSKTVEVAISSARSTVFPNASQKFNVQVEDHEGRYAYAMELIQTGEEVLTETPYAAALLPERMGTHCLHCFAKLRAPIPCETCANVAFCSKACRAKGEKYHRYECRVFSLLLGSGMSVLPLLALRIITQGSAEQFAKEYPELTSKPNEVLFDQAGAYQANSYRNIYNLTALESMRRPRDFLERTFMAIFLMKCLRLVGYFDINLFKNPDPQQEELLIGSLILRNLQVLQFNAYEICEFIMESKENFKSSRGLGLGLGIYPTAAFFNHSCAPNVSRYFSGTSMCVESIGPIPAGSSITDNYGPIFTKFEKQDRQLKLRGRYWFNCVCQACTEGWERLEDLPPEITPSNAIEGKVLDKLQKLGTTYFDKGLELMSQGQGFLAIQFLSKYVNEAEGLTSSNARFKNFKPILLAQEALKLCMSAKGTVHIVTQIKQ